MDNTPGVGTAPVQPEVSSEVPVRPNTLYAGFWKRFLASMVDALIVMIVGSTFQTIIQSDEQTHIVLSQTLLAAAYSIFFWVKQDGQTLGKRLLAIRVVREDGKPMDVSTGIIRYIGYLISAAVFGLGYLSVAWDSKKQGWHDKIAKTYVIKTEGRSRVGIALLIVAIPLLIGIIAFVAAFALGAFIFKSAQSDPAKFKQSLSKFEKQVGNVLPTMSEGERQDLEEETFVAINKYRTEQKLKPFQVDQKLCAYAQRRLQQYEEFGKSDDGKGFYEDLANKDIVNAYFSAYGTVGENMTVISSISNADDVAKVWSNGTDANIKSAQYTHGCVRASKNYIQLIVAAPLKK